VDSPSFVVTRKAALLRGLVEIPQVPEQEPASIL
jgi:hypothetical protein